MIWCDACFYYFTNFNEFKKKGRKIKNASFDKIGVVLFYKDYIKWRRLQIFISVKLLPFADYELETKVCSFLSYSLKLKESVCT